MAFLGAVGSAIGSAASAVGDVATSALDRLTSQSQNQQAAFAQDGFIVPPVSTATGDGLPSSQTPAQQTHRNKRNIIHWYVPQVGLINMYINPQQINYKYSKQIGSERTKGGFVLQYWGENLPILSISGNTGSSGFEGINVLYEIYRSEQLTFDPVGLAMASAGMTSGLTDTIDTIGQAIGGIGGDLVSGATNGILGLNPLTQSILPKNPPTLAGLAFGIEMYYTGKVYRGYFTSFDITESAQSLGLLEYRMEFVVTQQRGYRTNTFPWNRSANHGPSDNGVGGVPLSYGKGEANIGQLGRPANTITKILGQ